ncbi:MAG: hypothetical protein H6679_01935 [Epsilonproteobacteria bacterium]|nr:hypothetical protein [Campylobacterota bacterium]
MNIVMAAAFIAYIALVILLTKIGQNRSKKNGNAPQNHTNGCLITALAAHASDMGGWLFMGFPAAVYAQGMPEAWSAIGISFFMFLTWKFVAPQICDAAQKYQCATLAGFFAHRYNDDSGILRCMTALFSFIFYATYIGVGLSILGHLFTAAFNIPYIVGVIFGIFLIAYILRGGFASVTLIDALGGGFLFCVLMFIPALALYNIGGIAPILSATQAKNIPLTIFSINSLTQFKELIFDMSRWGLGYFGQPHIIIKFLGIDDVANMGKAKVIGMTWQALILSAAVSIGLIAIAFFPQGLVDNDLLFITMIKQLLPTFFAGLALCAMLISVINIIGSHVFVSSSIVSEDFFEKTLPRYGIISEQKAEKLSGTVAGTSIMLMCVIGFIVAYYKQHASIYNLIEYTWGGLGGSFGPLVLVSLNTTMASRAAAIAGLGVCGTTCIFWPLLGTGIPAMLISFILGLATMLVVNYINKK